MTNTEPDPVGPAPEMPLYNQEWTGLGEMGSQVTNSASYQCRSIQFGCSTTSRGYAYDDTIIEDKHSDDNTIGRTSTYWNPDTDWHHWGEDAIAQVSGSSEARLGYNTRLGYQFQMAHAAGNLGTQSYDVRIVGKLSGRSKTSASRWGSALSFWVPIIPDHDASGEVEAPTVKFQYFGMNDDVQGGLPDDRDKHLRGSRSDTSNGFGWQDKTREYVEFDETWTNVTMTDGNMYAFYAKLVERSISKARKFSVGFANAHFDLAVDEDADPSDAGFRMDNLIVTARSR